MNPAPNLVLVGPMGAGKTSLGKRVARRLGLEFVDADARLEQAAGVSVSTIFELEGEPGFRAREERLLDELLHGEAQVIATGGGAVLSAGNRERMRARAFVVYVRVTLERQLERLQRDQTRPLLAKGDRRQTLQALAEVRDPLYQSVADLVFDSDAVDIAAAARRLGAQVQSTWKRGQAA
jgi:shikimate kinase